jgi:hypothetical protein
MKDLNSVFLYSPDWDTINYPRECPFDTSRAGKTRAALFSMGLLSGKQIKEVKPNISRTMFSLCTAWLNEK